jgi:hypothetical protein
MRYGDGVHTFIDRVFHGFTPTDTWNIDNWFCDTMSRLLQEFKREAIGFSSGGGMTWEQWEAILNRMIFCFQKMKAKNLENDLTINRE